MVYKALSNEPNSMLMAMEMIVNEHSVARAKGEREQHTLTSSAAMHIFVILLASPPSECSIDLIPTGSAALPSKPQSAKSLRDVAV